MSDDPRKTTGNRCDIGWQLAPDNGGETNV